MVRTAQSLQKTVFLSVNNPLTPMADTQAWVQQMCAQVHASSVTGMVLAGAERWLCLMEGEAEQVGAMLAMMQRHARPRQWHVLMSDQRARARMFPQHRMGWRNACTPLEMAAFLSDLRRHPGRTQAWHFSLNDIFAMLEPVE